MQNKKAGASSGVPVHTWCGTLPVRQDYESVFVAQLLYGFRQRTKHLLPKK